MIRMESHRDGDLICLFKFGLVIHHIELFCLSYLINLTGKIAAKMALQLLFPCHETGSWYFLEHIGVKVP